MAAYFCKLFPFIVATWFVTTVVLVNYLFFCHYPASSRRTPKRPVAYPQGTRTPGWELLDYKMSQRTSSSSRCYSSSSRVFKRDSSRALVRLARVESISLLVIQVRYFFLSIRHIIPVIVRLTNTAEYRSESWSNSCCARYWHANRYVHEQKVMRNVQIKYAHVMLIASFVNKNYTGISVEKI